MKKRLKNVVLHHFHITYRVPLMDYTVWRIVYPVSRCFLLDCKLLGGRGLSFSSSPSYQCPAQGLLGTKEVLTERYTELAAGNQRGV